MDDEITGIIARDRDFLRVFCRLVIDLDFFFLLWLLDIIVKPFTDIRNQFLDAFMRCGRNGEELQALFFSQCPKARQIFLRLRQVDLSMPEASTICKISFVRSTWRRKS